MSRNFVCEFGLHFEPWYTTMLIVLEHSPGTAVIWPSAAQWAALLVL